MKCFTITEKGVMAGIKIMRKPNPHVAIGDPRLSSADYRRVTVDDALAGNATNDNVTTCSYTTDAKSNETRRATYKLIPATGKDDDRALVKIEAHCATAGNRSFYDLPRFTLTLANGWFLIDDKSPQVSTPVNLVILNKNDEVKIYRTVDTWSKPELVMTAIFDGSELKLKGKQLAAA